jgi:RNA polymerase sigma-70 factor, ECF subfamily
MPTNIPIKEKITAWAGGDDEAFRSVFDYFYPRLLAASQRIIQNSEDAEELVMNVLLKTWQCRAQMADIEAPDDYIFGIMRQQIAGFMRKKVIVANPIEEVPLPKLGVIREPEITLREIRERYQAALLKLSSQRKKIFLMSREDQLSHQEIASRTGLSVNTVNNHIKASLKVMRDEFQENMEIIGFLLIVSPAVFLV